MESERTPLFFEDSGGSVGSVIETRISRFQCCLLATLLPVLVALLVISVSVVLNHNAQPDIPASVLPPEAATHQLTDDSTVSVHKSSVYTTIPADIVSGEVSGGQTKDNVAQLWNGTFPVAFPTSATNMSIIWSGALDISSATSAKVWGTFSYKNWFGHFSVSLNSPLPAKLEEQIQPWIPYSSIIVFKVLDTPPANGDTNPSEIFADGISIILKGNVCLNQTSFCWDGRSAIVFPSSK